MITLVVATRNAHKVGEIRAILGVGFCYLTLRDFPEAPEVVEDAGTFHGNAAKKAVELARWLGEAGRLSARTEGQTGTAQGYQVFVLADDSGLEVDALNGAPGVHSARFAALDTGKPGNSSTPENNAKLLRLLVGVPSANRSARFRCVLALAPVLESRPEVASPPCYADPAELQVRLFDGVCEGQIGFAPRGQGGFGYDPLFLPDGFDLTFAELGEEVKNRLSHRARALQKLRHQLESAAGQECSGGSY